MIKIISTCNTNKDCLWPSRKGTYGTIIKGGRKVLKKGWVQYVEINTLPNGKKTSVTRHGPKPS